MVSLIYIYIYVYIYIHRFTYICFISFIPFNFFFYRFLCRRNPWRHGPQIFHCGFTQPFRITIWRHGPQHKLRFLGEILPKSPACRFVSCCLPIYLFSQILVYLNPLFYMEIWSVTIQCVVPPFLEKKFACWHSHVAKQTIPFLRSGYEEEISYFMATTWVGAITPMIFVSQDENPPSWISSYCLKGLDSNFGTASLFKTSPQRWLESCWMWHEHDSPRRSSSKTSFVGFKCHLHTLSKSTNLWGHSLSAATYWRLHPPGVGPDKSSSHQNCSISQGFFRASNFSDAPDWFLCDLQLFLSKRRKKVDWILFFRFQPCFWMASVSFQVLFGHTESYPKIKHGHVWF